MSTRVNTESNTIAMLDRFETWSIRKTRNKGRAVHTVQIRAPRPGLACREIVKASSRNLHDAIRSAIDKADGKKPQGRPSLRLVGGDHSNREYR